MFITRWIEVYDTVPHCKNERHETLQFATLSRAEFSRMNSITHRNPKCGSLKVADSTLGFNMGKSDWTILNLSFSVPVFFCSNCFHLQTENCFQWTLFRRPNLKLTCTINPTSGFFNSNNKKERIILKSNKITPNNISPVQ
jgi:hypothetical protein